MISIFLEVLLLFMDWVGSGRVWEWDVAGPVSLVMSFFVQYGTANGVSSVWGFGSRFCEHDLGTLTGSRRNSIEPDNTYIYVISFALFHFLTAVPEPAKTLCSLLLSFFCDFAAKLTTFSSMGLFFLKSAIKAPACRSYCQHCHPHPKVPLPPSSEP